MPDVSFAPRAASWGLLGLLTLAGLAPAEERPSAPRTSAEELATLRLADPVLRIELVAAEPDVISPVAIAWDESGRLFVAEMTDDPAGPTSGRIRLLEDRDGDGRFDRICVFAEGLAFPIGVLPATAGPWSPRRPTSCASGTTTATAAPRPRGSPM